MLLRILLNGSRDIRYSVPDLSLFYPFLKSHFGYLD